MKYSSIEKREKTVRQVEFKYRKTSMIEEA
jgi:hypothetical protein